MSSSLQSLILSLLSHEDLRSLVGSPLSAGHSSGDRLVDPASIQAAAAKLPPPRSLPSIELPFQIPLLEFDFKESKTYTWDVASNNLVTGMLSSFSRGQLLSLECIVFPFSSSLTFPCSFDVIWCASNQSISGDDLLKTFGSKRITFGGPVSSSLPIEYPCNLESFNPMVKDSVAYVDLPRLTVRTFSDPDAAKLKIFAGNLVIRGVISASGIRPMPLK
nr:coat protein [Styphnolobium tymo-like virus]